MTKFSSYGIYGHDFVSVDGGKVVAQIHLLSHLLIILGSLNRKLYGSRSDCFLGRSDCFLGSNLATIHSACFHDKI